ncbi:MAG TPA: hypothetical protein VEL07_17060 [Planctomycetota bacterium]|nr:hypothetical protein [Planctomycetota bacterium]
MHHRARTAALLLMSAAALAAEDAAAIVIQDFEDGAVANTEHGTATSEEWHASGARSLRIATGGCAWIDTFTTHDWSSRSALRLHVHNPHAEAATLGVWIIDELAHDYWDWHINSHTVAPGDQVITIDYSGDLWRSETGRQYRGKVKTPVDVSRIKRLAVSNPTAGAIAIDRVEIVALERLATPGGFAFDFGRPHSVVMGQFTGIFPETIYAPGGYGLLSRNSRVLSQAMPYPTPMLGDGIAWPDEGFAVDLPGGDYVGMIAFERGGFWGVNESAGYRRAALSANGAVVHEHASSPSDVYFQFEDTEVASMAEAVDKLIFPAHVVSRIAFAAAPGRNVFTLAVEGSTRYPLRVAGLILAPATAEGRAFIDAHEHLQRTAFTATFGDIDRGRRGEGRVACDAPLVHDLLEPGEAVYPRDLPRAARRTVLPEQAVVRGQTLCLHLALHAAKTATITVAAGGLAGAGSRLGEGVVSHGRYLPVRPPASGSAWITVNHYRPEASCSIGPELARSVIVEYRIPEDAKAGAYTATIAITGAGPAVRIPLTVRISPVRLADIPIGNGLFNNAFTYDPTVFDAETFWPVQEDVLREQMTAGLNVLTSGGNYDFVDGRIVGDDAKRTIRLAQKYGTVRAIVPYGGFWVNAPGDDHATRFAALARGFEALEREEGLPPHYFSVYDEPTTDVELKSVLEFIGIATAAGVRTMGYTSIHGEHDDPRLDQIMKASFAPALNLHSPAALQRLKASGCEPWVYNNGGDRYGNGIHLWRNIRAGAAGRIEWIGVQTEGFAFHDLDGREPSAGCFAAHSRLGVLKAPRWLAHREGYLDCRVRITLESLVEDGDPALALWTMDGYRTDSARWGDDELNRARWAMLARIEEVAPR